MSHLEALIRREVAPEPGPAAPGRERVWLGLRPWVRPLASHPTGVLPVVPWADDVDEASELPRPPGAAGGSRTSPPAPHPRPVDEGSESSPPAALPPRPPLPPPALTRLPDLGVGRRAPAPRAADALPPPAQIDE